MRMILIALLLATSLAGCSTVEETESDRVLGQGQADLEGPAEYDYYDGADKMTVMDMQVYGRSVSLVGEAGFLLRPGAGAIVPPGTSHLTLRITWADEGVDSYGSAHLYVSPAGTQEFEHLGAYTSGSSVQIATTQDSWDPPLSEVSGWAFILGFSQGPGTSTVVAEYFQVELTAFRGFDSVSYDAPRDPWSGADEMLLLNTTGQATLATGWGSLAPGICVTGCFSTIRLPDGIIVPRDATTIRVALTYDLAAGPGGYVMGDPIGNYLGLEYHQAHSRNFHWAESTLDGKTRYYDLDVSHPDSPWATESNWEFRVSPEEPNKHLPGSGSYQIQVWAQR